MPSAGVEQWILIHAAERPGQMPIEWVRAAREDARHVLAPESRYRRALWILGETGIKDTLREATKAIAEDEASGVWRFRIVLGLVSLAVTLGFAPWWAGYVVKAGQVLVTLAEGGNMDSSLWLDLLSTVAAAAGASGVFTLLARKVAKALVAAVPRSVWPIVSMVAGFVAALIAGIDAEMAFVVGSTGGLVASGVQGGANAAVKDMEDGPKSTKEM